MRRCFVDGSMAAWASSTGSGLAKGACFVAPLPLSTNNTGTRVITDSFYSFASLARGFRSAARNLLVLSARRSRRKSASADDIVLRPSSPFAVDNYRTVAVSRFLR
ncbi:hypothetical protein K491DRAFT_76486 [Lophiostoma macrostomum CBS 122681]|uniref:Uncharacterized protein n=1 Tax=Lophiostoma macrostomum CBS 122681 TaxID=1314788 RepID=A0A6A6SZW1_9PLEO|nr:hypothetical protein K491DRAFT_76486 [Lophiostoma macrostomum CBS 122681]